MSNIVELPNGSRWDNDLGFREQEPTAQVWYFNVLRSVMEAIANKQTVVPNVEMISWKQMGVRFNRLTDYYNVLASEGIVLYASDWYRHKDWGRVINEGYVIPPQDWYNPDNWEVSPNTKFTVQVKIENDVE